MRVILTTATFILCAAIVASAPDTLTRIIGALVCASLPIILVVQAWIGDRGIVETDADE